MKKTGRNILIMLLVLLVLGGVSAWLFLVPSQEEAENSSSAPSSQVSSAAGETLVKLKAEDVTSISVKNQEDSFQFVSQGEDFSLEGYEDCDLNTTMISSSVGNLLSMTASKNLGSQEDLKEFGLSGEAAVEVEISRKDGTKEKLTLGGKAGESAGRYVLKDGTVYIVASISEQLYGGKFEYFSSYLYSVAERTSVVTAEDGTESTETLPDILYSLKLSGTNYPEPVEIKYDESVTSGYLMTAPVKAESGSNGLTTLSEGVKAPTALGVAAVHLTDELLEEYGLLEPAARIEFTLNADTHTMSVSKADPDGNRYLLLDDRDVVYRVAKSAVESWAEIPLLKLRMSYIWLSNIKDVKKLSLTANGTDYRFDMTRTLNEEQSIEDSPQYDLAVKNAAGKEISYDDYRSFYQDLISVAVLSTETTEFSGTPLFRVSYGYFDNSEENVIEFYPAENDRCVAVLNGEFNGVVRKSEVEKLASRLAEVHG